MYTLFFQVFTLNNRRTSAGAGETSFNVTGWSYVALDSRLRKISLIPGAKIFHPWDDEDENGGTPG